MRATNVGQAVNEVVHDQVGHLDVFACGVDEVVAADGEGVAVAAEGEHVQVGPRDGKSAGEGQRTTVNVVHAVCLHKVREPAGAADAGHGGHVLVGDVPLLDQLVVDGEHGKITAARAPGRVIGGDLFFGHRLAFPGVLRGVLHCCAVAHVVKNCIRLLRLLLPNAP